MQPLFSSIRAAARRARLLFIFLHCCPNQRPHREKYYVSLSTIFLGGNQQNGSVPEEIGFMSDLSSLTYPINELALSLPMSLGKLCNLMFPGHECKFTFIDTAF